MDITEAVEHLVDDFTSCSDFGIFARRVEFDQRFQELDQRILAHMGTFVRKVTARTARENELIIRDVAQLFRLKRDDAIIFRDQQLESHRRTERILGKLRRLASGSYDNYAGYEEFAISNILGEFVDQICTQCECSRKQMLDSIAEYSTEIDLNLTDTFAVHVGNMLRLPDSDPPVMTFRAFHAGEEPHVTALPATPAAPTPATGRRPAAGPTASRSRPLPPAAAAAAAAAASPRVPLQQRRRRRAGGGAARGLSLATKPELEVVVVRGGGGSSGQLTTSPYSPTRRADRPSLHRQSSMAGRSLLNIHGGSGGSGGGGGGGAFAGSPSLFSGSATLGSFRRLDKLRPGSGGSSRGGGSRGSGGGGGRMSSRVGTPGGISAAAAVKQSVLTGGWNDLFAGGSLREMNEGGTQGRGGGGGGGGSRGGSGSRGGGGRSRGGGGSGGGGLSKAAAAAQARSAKSFTLPETWEELVQTLRRVLGLASITKMQVRDAASGVESPIEELRALRQGDCLEVFGVTKAAAALETARCTKDLDSALCTMAIYSEQEEVQKQGCAVLGSLATGEDEQANKFRSRLASRGVIGVLVATLARLTHSSDVTATVCFALAQLSLHSPNAVRVDSAGGIALVKRALADFTTVFSVQRMGCAALVNLSRNHAPRQAAVAEGQGVRLIVHAMKKFASDSSLQIAGCRALIHLSLAPDHAVEAIRVTGIRAAVLPMMAQFRKDPEVQYYGCALLSHLLGTLFSAAREAHTPPEDFLGVSSAGRLLQLPESAAALLRAMQSCPLSSDVQWRASLALGVLAENSRACLDQIVSNNGVELVLSAMERYPLPVVQRWGCSLLRGLASEEGDTPSKTAVVQRGGISGALAAMRCCPSVDAVQRQGCLALRNMVGSSDTLQLMLSAGGIDTLLGVIEAYDHNIHVINCAAVALAAFMRGSPENQAAAADAGAARKLLRAVRSHPSSAVVCTGAFRALAALCTSRQRQTQVGKLKAHETVVEVMQPLRLSPAVQIAACGALHAMAKEHTENQTLIADSGGILALMDTMRVCNKYSEVVVPCCRALGAIVLAHPQNQLLYVERGGIELTMECTLRRFDGDPLAKEAGCDLISCFTHQNDDAMAAMLAQEAHKKLFDVVDANMEVPAVAASACHALATLCATSPDVVMKVVEDGGISFVLRVLTRVQEVSPADKALMLLAALTDVASKRRQAMELRADDTVVDVINRFPNQETIRTRGYTLRSKFEQTARLDLASAGGGGGARRNKRRFFKRS